MEPYQAAERQTVKPVARHWSR